ncbi:hypothetical protein SAMN05444422_1242 [Halobiforma haloterrestris]|uniref:Uncharacterized protein n=1 Tax=Natronobacterium haloterrestre TaxID=148448 RepID=A0A1I1LU98_NATHA|nr:hypothetical protein SAMN05444422_1242 [Halobiforma haloterrestris]
MERALSLAPLALVGLLQEFSLLGDCRLRPTSLALENRFYYTRFWITDLPNLTAYVEKPANILLSGDFIDLEGTCFGKIVHSHVCIAEINIDGKIIEMQSLFKCIDDLSRVFEQIVSNVDVESVDIIEIHTERRLFVRETLC